MPKKELRPYDVGATLVDHDNWSIARLAKHHKVTERTIRKKLSEYLSEIQCELSDLECEVEAIEHLLEK